jgi:hypothetical protein
LNPFVSALQTTPIKYVVDAAIVGGVENVESYQVNVVSLVTAVALPTPFVITLNGLAPSQITPFMFVYFPAHVRQ